MSFRARVIALGAVFIVLLAALLVGIFVSPRGAADRASAALLFPGLKAEKVLAVEISGPSGRLLISRSANGNAPAAQEQMRLRRRKQMRLRRRSGSSMWTAGSSRPLPSGSMDC